MRNGNFSAFLQFLCKLVRTFLSYLWGMETSYTDSVLFVLHQRSYPTYEEWKLVSGWSWALMYSVLILPMRNGNIKKSIVYSLSLICSYPTYEEWKLKTLEYLNKVWLCSYPTYEEWKQTYHLPVYPCFCKFLSYLWGMETENKNNDWYYFRIVLILPMRNGNAKLSRYNSMIEIVLILPMRNGNYRFHLRLQWTSFQFLSYLWGMETLH